MSQYNPGKTVVEGDPTAPLPVAIDQTGDNNDVDVISSVLPTGAATDSTLQIIDTDLKAAQPRSIINFPSSQVVTESNLDLNFGTWGYASGVSGTPTIGTGKRILAICAHSTLGGSFTINGGSTITVPANVSVNIEPLGNIVNPAIVFTGTDTYFVEFVS